MAEGRRWDREGAVEGEMLGGGGEPFLWSVLSSNFQYRSVRMWESGGRGKDKSARAREGGASQGESWRELTNLSAQHNVHSHL